MPTHLALDDHLTALVDSGAVLRKAAARAGLDAPVPTCPSWDVRKLVTHQGMVHRWAAANLRRTNDRRTREWQAEAAGATDLLAWFSGGLDALVETIRATPDDAKAMTFLNDAPPPRRFWARRQAHETTIHSADAVAAGLERWPAASDLSLSPRLAADGIDELLCGFITRGRGKLRSVAPLTIVVSTTDTGHAWTVRTDQESLSTTARTSDTQGTAEPVDATITGSAAQVYLGLWNRGDEVAVEGRADVRELWRSQVRVRWGG